MREISGTLSPERILETAVGRIHEAFQYPVVAISMAEPDGSGYRIAAVATRDGRPPIGRYAMNVGIVGRSYREKRTQNVGDVSADPDYNGLVSTTRSEVAVPILWGDEVVAVLDVEREIPGSFNPSEVITLETLADGIGIMLRNAELYQALERTNAKLVELDRMKSELVNIVAHDFRAPLAGVLGHAELLEWRPDAPRADRLEQARSIIHAATHMANLVEKTLDEPPGDGPVPVRLRDRRPGRGDARGRRACARARQPHPRRRHPRKIPSPAGRTATGWPRCSTTSSRTR